MSNPLTTPFALTGTLVILALLAIYSPMAAVGFVAVYALAAFLLGRANR